MECEEMSLMSENQDMYSRTYEEFLGVLAEHETATKSRFVYQKCSKRVLDVKAAISKPNVRIHWQENIPHIWLESSLFVCHQGKDFNANKKKKYSEDRESKDRIVEWD
ncbi:uncharacterized protein LOC129003812 isoform X3 [Macrosteles quadrilineatus]|uniref:uncharacterized protein LOC129003812 isoform X3 n=1 Tax=Macrosteles quadrilineatus TaxID=74068 RepID=UPI0023E1B138|nr:uncharacterized protein LOC129003812 isoform X3 [Macrosteles quadrilineatus]